MRTFITACLLLLLTCAFSGCKVHKSYSVKGEFRYYNRLTSPVRVVLVNGLNQAYAEYNIATGDSLVLNTIGDTDSEGPSEPNGYRPGISADTATVQFNDTLCYKEFNKSGPVLHTISKYTHQKRGEKDYLFFFNIDSSLVQLATKCK